MESPEFLIEASDSMHVLPHALQHGCGPRPALGDLVPADQLEDRGKPFLRQLIHQMVELIPRDAHALSVRRRLRLARPEINQRTTQRMT